MSEIRDADGRIIEDETPDSVGDKESTYTGDTKRLDWVLAQGGWMDWDNDWTREAIDAAMKASPVSTPSQTPTATVREQKESVWIKTSERAPTEKDSDWGGNVFAITEDHIPELVDVDSVASTPYLWPYWMPIPALPVPES